MTSFDDVAGTTCRVGTAAEGVMEVTYATNGDVSLRCVATSLFPLDVTVSAGHGTVSSAPAGINCPSDCSEYYGTATMVTLTETPGFNAYFSGWGGACSGQAATCTVTMDQARSVTASFAGNSVITVTVSNSGTHTLLHTYGTNRVVLVGTQFVCQASGETTRQCQVTVPTGQPVTFVADTDPGDSFAYWSGCATNCTFTPEFPTYSITAVFDD